MKGDESYCFWKRLLTFLKGSMSASIETDHINHKHFNSDFWNISWLDSGNHNLTLGGWKPCTMCLVWWFWICRCGLFSQSMNGNSTGLSGWCVGCTIGEHYLFSNRWVIGIDILIVLQGYFPTYTKQALESLKIHPGFPLLALLTFWAK